MGSYAYNAGQEKEMLEQKNEYKIDINELILEEKEKQKIANTKEFSNYLNNKEYYNDRVLKAATKVETQEAKLKKQKDMLYLKQLAFREIKEKTEKKQNNINKNGN